MKKCIYNVLTTPYEANLDTNHPYPDYPRPQFVRNSYINLNGYWEYAITKEDAIPSKFDGSILVPFCPESKLSGVERRIVKGEYLYYKRSFIVPKEFINDKVILHFGAVDYECWVYVNDELVAHNDHGYLPFECEIQSHLKAEENELIVKVKDDLDPIQPYGKQVRKPKGMWYTQVSGIWQTVWLESVSNDYIRTIKIDVDFDNKKVNLAIDSDACQKEITVLFAGKELANLTTNDNNVSIKLKSIKAWSPEKPNLYDLVVKSQNDEVKSYFAFRKIHIENGRILLNNKPYFFNGLLDQGYYPDGIFLPATKDGFIDDIKRMKELGFNTLRKHIKIEPMEFYYQCDKLGMIVFQDMVNNGKYKFVAQTALPTIGFKYFSDRKSKNNKYYLKFIDSATKTVNHLYNCPCILYWTIYNEAWGQINSDDMYELFKTLDTSRIIDSTSGWYFGKKSDVFSDHVYFKTIKYKEKKIPTIISEFGGYSYKIDEHSHNLTNTYGYANYYSKESFEDAVIKLYKEQILPYIDKGLCGAIYTQVSDVEDETNGFLTYDRQLLKVDKKKFKELFKNINI